MIHKVKNDMGTGQVSKKGGIPRIFLIIIFLVLSSGITVQADIIFPARIEMKETTPGEFDVLFTLPIINNKKLKAEVVLPDVCQDLGEHTISSTYTSYIETWKVACIPDDLFGESIEIKGLLGTFVEVMLQIEMLDGRSYSTTLKPSRASFTIPKPLSIFHLVSNSSYSGIRHVIIKPEIYLLLFVIAFFIPQRKSILLALLGYVLAHLVSQYLAQELLIKLSPYLSKYIVLVLVLFPAFDLVQGKPALRRWFQPLWVLAIILGFLSGGSFTNALSLPGLSYFEQYFVIIGINLGIAIGLLLIFLLIREFKQLLTMFVLRTRPQKAHIILGYLIGVSAFALLLFNSTSVLVVPSILPEVSFEFFIFPILFGYWFWRLDTIRNYQAVALYLVILAMGTVLGGSGIGIPLGFLFLYTSILVISFQLILDWKFSLNIQRVFASVSVFFFGWTVSQVIFENLTLPIANTVGFAGLTVCLFYVGYSFLTEKPSTGNSIIVTSLAGIAAFSIFFLRIEEYIVIFNREIATNLAMGRLTIPLISLILFIGTILVWPRRRKIHTHLQVERKRPIQQWAIIVLAFLCLPFGHISMTNPFFTSRAPQGNEAKLVLQQILTNTYHAFNSKEEDELYQNLAESVSGDLVATIYLDSRRRLTAGVRQGGEVTVRDVSVVSVGDLIEGTNPAEGFSYMGKWTVTARVKHLQHIHHRKNIYSGILKIKVEDNNWKISNIELQSEDRMIVTGIQG